MKTDKNSTPTLAEVERSSFLYWQFILLLLAAGAIYPIIYLRQNFETTILSSFGISAEQLGNFYSALGWVYVLTYLPSGWLADKFSPRLLITFSLAAVGGLGLWFSTFQSTSALLVIFMGWGLAAGLTFWASLIKGVKMLAKSSEQGRAFGALDGGRGLVEAVLASVALAIFAYYSSVETPKFAMQKVIYMYSFTCLAIAVCIFIFFGKEKAKADQKVKRTTSLMADFGSLLSNKAVLLLALIVFCGYQLFWATYSFSAFLQEGYGLTAVGAGFMTVAKLWMRPIGGFGAGFLGDRFSKEGVLGFSMMSASVALVALSFLPSAVHHYVLLGVVLLLGFLTYAIRGLYWSLLDSCKLPIEVTGLAIGVVSVIAYMPDVLLPKINNFISALYPGVQSYQLYFLYISICGVVGFLATIYFKHITKGK